MNKSPSKYITFSKFKNNVLEFRRHLWSIFDEKSNEVLKKIEIYIEEQKYCYTKII